MSNRQTLSLAYVNAFRVSTVSSRLLALVRGEVRLNNSEFCNLCLSLARGIDYAVSNNESPSRAPDLPYLLKQVCRRKNDLSSQAAIMVLMKSDVVMGGSMRRKRKNFMFFQKRCKAISAVLVLMI